MCQCSAVPWLSHPTHTHKRKRDWEREIDTVCMGVVWVFQNILTEQSTTIKAMRVGICTLTAGTGFFELLTRAIFAPITPFSPEFLIFFLYAAMASVLCCRYGPKLGSFWTHIHSKTYFRGQSTMHPNILHEGQCMKEIVTISIESGLQ